MAVLQLLEERAEAELKNYGDVQALLKSNPLLSALFQELVKAVSTEVIGFLNERLPPREMNLLNYEDIAKMLHVKVGVVRQWKSRGYLKAAKLGEHGTTLFTLKAIEEFKLNAEQREIATTKKKQANMAVVGKTNHHAA